MLPTTKRALSLEKPTMAGVQHGANYYLVMDSKEGNSASNVLVALDFGTLNWTLVGAAPALGPSPLCQRWMTASNNGQMTIVGGDRLHQKLNDLYTCWCTIPEIPRHSWRVCIINALLFSKN